MTAEISVSLSVDTTDELREELRKELEEDPEIEKATIMKTMSGIGIEIGLIIGKAILGAVVAGLAKEGLVRLKNLIKRSLEKAKKKTGKKPKLTFSYEVLTLHFTSTEDKHIEKELNELRDYVLTE